MFDPQENKFVPVPQDRGLTAYERKLIKFEEGEIVFVKGMSFFVTKIGDLSLVLSPVPNPMAATNKGDMQCDK